MPAAYWLPLAVTPPVALHHLHGAFSAWFDEAVEGEPPRHHDETKPFRVTPVRDGVDGPGVEISVLTERASRQLIDHAHPGEQLRFGRDWIVPGTPELLARASWQQLADDVASRWRVEFQTPTVFRTDGRRNLLPTASMVLRSPSLAWTAYGPEPTSLSHSDLARVTVSDMELVTADVEVGVRLKGDKKHPHVEKGVLGWIEFSCLDRPVAAKVSALLNLARYTGTGSFKPRGLGVVDIQVLERPRG